MSEPVKLTPEMEARLLKEAHRLAAFSPILFAKLLGLPLYPWQEKMLNLKKQYSMWNIHRQGAKSSTAAIYGIHICKFRKDALVLVIAPSERQSKELLIKVKKIGQLAVEKQLGAAITTDNATTIEFDNGSRFIALPGTEGTIKGFSSPDLIILDEAAQIQDSVYAAVSPMLAISKGKLMMLSTPWGQRGFYYDTWVMDKDKAARYDAQGRLIEDEWLRVKLDATQCPVIKTEWLDAERRRIGDVMFNTNYMCEFLPNSNSMFSIDNIDSATIDAPLFMSEGNVIAMNAGANDPGWKIPEFSDWNRNRLRLVQEAV